MPSAQWKQFNCYKELEVPPTASPQEIRKARNQAASRYHPDRGGSHERQVRINIAYEVLSDPIARQSHDIHWGIFQSSGGTQPRTAQSEPRARSEPLGGFRRRVCDEIEKKKRKIWQDLKDRTQKNEADFLKRYSDQRRSAILTFIGLIPVGALALRYSVFWVGVFFLGCFGLSTLVPIRIANRAFSIFDLNAPHNLREHAHEAAKQSCATDVKKVEAYLPSLASISQLLLRPSTFDDSEEQVARRLTASFFLMGYIPLLFDKQNRALTFTDGDEKIMVRFRHRDGSPTNINYVRKLVGLMREQGISRGFLFCSPGLSGNAKVYAQQNKVIWYQLESMNKWIDHVLTSDYSGPTGEVLDNLDKLQRFISYISPWFTARSYTI